MSGNPEVNLDFTPTFTNRLLLKDFDLEQARRSGIIPPAENVKDDELEAQ